MSGPEWCGIRVGLVLGSSTEGNDGERHGPGCVRTKWCRARIVVSAVSAPGLAEALESRSPAGDAALRNVPGCEAVTEIVRETGQEHAVFCQGSVCPLEIRSATRHGPEPTTLWEDSGASHVPVGEGEQPGGDDSGGDQAQHDHRERLERGGGHRRDVLER